MALLETFAPVELRFFRHRIVDARASIPGCFAKETGTSFLREKGK